jgi:hypothetical protein
VNIAELDIEPAEIKAFEITKNLIQFLFQSLSNELVAVSEYSASRMTASKRQLKLVLSGYYDIELLLVAWQIKVLQLASAGTLLNELF